jgi:hypothetical protein
MAGRKKKVFDYQVPDQRIYHKTHQRLLSQFLNEVQDLTLEELRNVYERMLELRRRRA